MNKANIKKAIKILERQGKKGFGFDVSDWITMDGDESEPLTTEAQAESVVRWGAEVKTCLGGAIAISPEFQKDGGGINTFNRTPVLYRPPSEDGPVEAHHGIGAMATWFDISKNVVRYLIGQESEALFGVDMCNITREAMIEQLEFLLENGYLVCTTIIE